MLESISQTVLSIHITENLLEHTDLVQEIWGGAQDCAFLTGPLEILRLLVQDLGTSGTSGKCFYLRLRVGPLPSRLNTFCEHFLPSGHPPPPYPEMNNHQENMHLSLPRLTPSREKLMPPSG